MQLSGLDLGLWLTSLLLNILLTGVLFVRRRAGAFPLFTALVAFNVVRTMTLFFVNRYAGSDAYYYTYLPMAAGDIVLQVAVAYEITLHVFRPDGRWNMKLKQSLRVLFAVAVVIALAVSWIALPPTEYLLDTALIRSNFFSAALMSELCIAVLVTSVRAGLPWRMHVTSIARGFGAYSLLSIIIEVLHVYFGLKSGTDAYRVVSRCRIAVYEAIVVYWIVSLFRDAPTEREMPAALRLQLLSLQERVGSLLAALQRWGDA